MRNFSNKKPKEIKDFYNQFVSSISQRIKSLKDLTKKEEFTYSFEEIKDIENFYAKSIKNVSKLNMSKDTLEDIVATYFGTACRNYLGGKWDVEMDKKVDTYGHIYVDYYDYEFETGSFFYPYWYTYGLESKQDKVGGISELIKYFFNLQIEEQKKIKGYKIKPIKDIN